MGPVQREKPNWTGRVLDLDVESVAHGGHCVARYEGRVVFVRHALPGETVRAEVTEDVGGGYCRADAIEVLVASADRVDPPCPLAEMSRGRDRCGGCDWQHVAARRQRELKSDVVTEQLRRIAGLDYRVEVQELAGGPLRWRTRSRLAVDGAGRPGFRAHRSHRIIPAADCPITIADALDGVPATRWKPGAEVEVTLDGTGRAHVAELRRGRRRQVRGSGVAREHAVGRTWNVAAGGFWQIHPKAADTFAELVRRWASAPQGGVAWDLYAGVGLFSAVLAEQVGPDGAVELVESGREAVRDATNNLGDLPQVRCHAGSVDEVLAGASLPSPDVVVLDPPRKGAGRPVVDAVVDHRPARVVYVACDPAALARDVALFVRAGYQLREIEGFDAFPMTHHVECLALLERADSSEC